jgi:hypothetical protein
VPLTGAIAAPIIEPEAIAPPPPGPAINAAGPRDENVARSVTPSRSRSEPAPIKAELKPEPVIPLVHAPDDPGPDAVEENEAPASEESGGWRKILQ